MYSSRIKSHAEQPCQSRLRRLLQSSLTACHVTAVTSMSIGSNVPYRLVRRQEETRAQRGQMKQLKNLMQNLVNVTGDPQKQQLDAIRNARELAFLITDLQDSTAMAAANAAAFRKVQDIHDTVYTFHEWVCRFECSCKLLCSASS